MPDFGDINGYKYSPFRFKSNNLMAVLLIPTLHRSKQTI